MHKATDPELIDNDNPEWTEADLKHSRQASELPQMTPFVEHSRKMKAARGRPKSANPKVATSLRLTPEVLAYFKSTGKGWQTRINKILEEYVNKHA